MLCDNCKKKTATVHIKHIGPDGSKETHLCESCAKEDGHFQFSPQISFQKFFPQFFGMTEPTYDTELSCPACGMTLARLAENGKPGCPNCYQIFSDSLRPLLKRLHANSQHTGKIPGKSGEIIKKDREIARLREELNRAVKDERFEEAAKLRDKIRLLEIEQDTLFGNDDKKKKTEKIREEGNPGEKDD